MADDLVFFGWSRPGGSLAATAANGRLRAGIDVMIRGVETGEEESKRLTFEFHGPRDVTGLLPGAVTGMSPAPGVTDAEETMAAYVELAAPDLPWRYSPEPRAGDRWRPWLVLVVGRTDQIVPEANGRVAIAREVLQAHPLAYSGRWAHVQQTNPPSGLPHATARIVSPCDLQPNTDYLAVLVPAFSASGDPSWTGAAGVSLQAYHSWRFRTGDAGDFKDLALRLKARPADDPGLADLGRTALEYPLPDRANTVIARGALAAPAAVPPDGADPDGPAPADVRASILAMRLPETDSEGRRVTQLPRYGEAWADDPSNPADGWGAQVNEQPRHRVAAGLGLWCGVTEQDLIADAARRRAGGLFIAGQRIRALVAGLAGAGALWRRRLPATPAGRLALFGPGLGRVAAADDPYGAGTVLAAITDPDNGRGNGRPMPPALLSSAARRLLRPGTARARRTGPGALRPEAVVAAANTCRRLEPELRPARAGDAGASQRGLPHADFLAARLGREEGDNLLGPIDGNALARWLQDAGIPGSLVGQLPQGLWPELVRAACPADGGPPDTDSLRQIIERAPRDDGRWGETLERARRDEPQGPACRPVDLSALDAVLTEAFRPRRDGMAVRRVLAGIDGLDPGEPLAPPEICPDLDLPAWRFLRDQAPGWLLPGRDGIRADEVVALSTNPRFIHAFLVGLNTQALGELRWRNLPVRAGCTPLRRFWDRITAAAPGTPSRPMTDIVGISRWDARQPIGHPDQTPDPDGTRDLVMAFRTDLFRRYPRTLVYLAPAPLGADGKADWSAPPDFAGNTAPVFSGEIDPDLVFFGFPLPPEALAQRWVVVEEPPPGYRFRARDVGGFAEMDGGVVASTAFAQPTRVLFRGDLFLGAE